ncbi:hypothetical protein [Halobacterium zhouii]|uniref:hypothetical protein n=1 Tax=Halobacterium zhouii TaxID=2902624 RepID=UPI001E2F590B|nr:hypothetical protein [Halobacterium zhouii]
MRVLLIPELYRPDDPSANGTLGDAAAWVRGWLDRDDSLHVYWLVAPNVPDDALLAGRERVTAIRADPFAAGDPDATDDSDGPGHSDAPDIFTEGGYTWDELRAIEREVYDRGAYLDCVVDQRRTGRFTLHKWLCWQTDRWAADVTPFDVVANVHDLQVPFKYRYCAYRGAFQSQMELASAAFADGVWFKAGADARQFREHATEILREEVVDETLDGALETGSPIDFLAFEERYREEPRFLHLAGSMWEKKGVDELLAVGEHLHAEFGIETILTSMDPIPDAYADRDWVTAHPEADRGTYEAALDRGDLTVCASEYETMARTPFEQAASGQVLVLRDELWIYDCVPEDYPLVGGLNDLADVAVEAVENWQDAVDANRRLVAHVERVRDPDRSAECTLRDLRERVDGKREAYALDGSDDPVRAALDEAEREGRDRIALDDLRERTTAHTDDGRPATDSADYALADLVYALRSLGYRDGGNPGTPVFVRR